MAFSSHVLSCQCVNDSDEIRADGLAIHPSYSIFTMLKGTHQFVKVIAVVSEFHCTTPMPF